MESIEPHPYILLWILGQAFTRLYSHADSCVCVSTQALHLVLHQEHSATGLRQTFSTALSTVWWSGSLHKALEFVWVNLTNLPTHEIRWQHCSILLHFWSAGGMTEDLRGERQKTGTQSELKTMLVHIGGKAPAYCTWKRKKRNFVPLHLPLFHCHKKKTAT